jgi:hypothetical protein
MNCTMPTDPHFGKYYQKHLKCTKLNGLRPKTIDAYARAIRRIGNYFVCPPAQDHHLCHSDAPALTNSLGGVINDNYSSHSTTIIFPDIPHHYYLFIPCWIIHRVTMSFFSIRPVGGSP